MTAEFLGLGNNLFDYLAVLLFYGALFTVMRHANQRIELNFRRSYWVLYGIWSIGTFFGNYAFYRLSLMSFLPWLNNALHTFIWIGFCLGFLYAGCYRKSWWEQFLLFAIFSFLVKMAEYEILGTWEFDRFFFIPGNLSYILGWSLMDGLYPLLSAFALRIVSRYVAGVTTPWTPAVVSGRPQ